MELFQLKRQIDWVGQFKVAVTIAILLVVGSLALLAVRGLNFGVDFTGGLIVEVGYPDSKELDGIRDTLSAAGYDGAVVQHFGTSRDVLIRIAPDDTDADRVSNAILRELRAEDPAVQMRRVEFVGPQVGDDLKEQGGLAMLLSIIGILIYVALRFEYRFAFGAVIALVHDVILTLGFFSLLGIEFDLVVLAALLAVIGYSLNDTVVIYDRIRENFVSLRRASTLDVINISLNQTLSRTMMTGVTTLIVLTALLFLGGQVMYGFSMALIFGVLIGPLSSIYVASAAVMALGVSKQDLMPVKKEDVTDSMP